MSDITWVDTPADEAQRSALLGILAAMQPRNDALIDQVRAETAAGQGDPQWAGPSLPHPTEAGSEAERAELDEGWDNWQHGIEPNTSEEATL